MTMDGHNSIFPYPKHVINSNLIDIRVCSSAIHNERYNAIVYLPFVIVVTNIFSQKMNISPDFSI